MASKDREQETGDEARGEPEEGPPPNPFRHPAFLERARKQLESLNLEPMTLEQADLFIRRFIRPYLPQIGRDRKPGQEGTDSEDKGRR